MNPPSPSKTLTTQAFGNVQFSAQDQLNTTELLNMKLGPEFVSNRAGPGGGFPVMEIKC